MLGAVASFFSLSAVVPQVLRALRTRDVEGVSWATAVLSLATFTLWVVYAFAVADHVQIVNNVGAFMLLAALAVAVARAGGAGSSVWAALAAVPVGAIVGVVIVTTFGPLALAMVATAISSVRMVPQTRLALSGASLRGLDPLGAVLAWVGTGLWAVYGALGGDLGVLVCSTISLALQTVVLRARFRQVAVPVADDYELAA